MRMLVLFVVFAASGLGTITYAQTPDPKRLEQIEQERLAAEKQQKTLEAQRRAAEKDVTRLQDELVRTAAEAQTYERAALEAESRVAELRAEEKALLDEIYADRRALTDLLAALQRIERNPPPALATHPRDAKKAAQAAVLMGEISARITQRAEQLQVRLDNLQSVRRNLEAEQLLMREARRDLEARREKIARLVQDKQAAEAKLGQERDAAQAEAQRLASEAKDIRELIARFEAEAREARPRLKPDPSAPPRIVQNTVPVPRLKPRPDRPPEPLNLPPDTLRFADARGQLGPPAQGQIISKFGDRISGGEKAKGLTLATRGGAQVLSPYHGRVEFSGPFKNYDQVVIINAGEGYFLLLTGLDDVFVTKGTILRAGEPVGHMPAQNGSRLYVEFRKDSRSIDPAPWIGTEFARRG